MNRDVALSHDPNNEIHLRFRFPRYGWTVLALSIENAGSRSGVDVHFLSRNNKIGEQAVYLPIRPGRTSRRACYLPTLIWGVRLTLREVTTNASLKNFRLHCVSPGSAHDFLSQRLVDLHPLYRGSEKPDVHELIKEEATKDVQQWRVLALKRYDETFLRYSLKADYSQWIERTEKPRNLLNNSEGGLLSLIEIKPLISILLQPGKYTQGSLELSVDAIISQSYSHWELILSDCFPCKEIAEGDRRIRCCSSSDDHRNGWIDSLIDQASGAYFIVLSADGILAPNALLDVVAAINETPSAMLLYSDEDKIDGAGERFDPHFKPGWNPDLLMSQNYISNLAVFKNELIVSHSGLEENADDIDIYGLLLDCITRLDDTDIVHIPKILYHQFEIEKHAITNQEADEYKADAGTRLLNHYVEHKDVGVSIEQGLVPKSFRVRWPLSSPSPRVSLIIPTKNNFNLLEQCISSILNKTDYDNYEIIILDNRSDCPETLDYLNSITQEDRVSVHRWDHPFNYSKINNFGTTLVSGSIIGLLNNDIEVINSGWLEEMASHACRPEIGCVGAKLYYPNETIQHAGVTLGIGGVAGHSHKYFDRDDSGYFSRLRLVQNLSAVTGACMIFRRSVFEAVGGLDENLAVAFNDVDFCLRVRDAGYRNLWTPYAEAYHHESKTRGENNTPLKRERARLEAEYMRKRWGAALDNDPAYNPNLTLVHEDFSLK